MMEREATASIDAYKKMIASLGEIFDSLLPKDRDTLGWEEMKQMNEKWNPQHDQYAGGHWNYDDATA